MNTIHILNASADSKSPSLLSTKQERISILSSSPIDNRLASFSHVNNSFRESNLPARRIKVSNITIDPSKGEATETTFSNQQSRSLSQSSNRSSFALQDNYVKVSIVPDDRIKEQRAKELLAKEKKIIEDTAIKLISIFIDCEETCVSDLFPKLI